MARLSPKAEVEKRNLQIAAINAEIAGDYRVAADLYGQVFRMERLLGGMTIAARNQMRCMFAAWRLECKT